MNEDSKTDDLHGDSQQSWGKAPISRRKLLAALGVSGAAFIASGLPGGLLPRAQGETVSENVYGNGKDQKKVTQLELQSMNGIQAGTLAEWLSQPPGNINQIYYVTDAGREGHFYYDVADLTSPADGGTIYITGEGVRFKRIYEGSLNARWFGAAADGITDDTDALRRALEASRGKSLYLPHGVYLITDTLTIPRNTFVRGVGNSSWFTFGQRRNELPDSILDMENGTILKFIGSGASRFSSNRSEFQNFTCAVRFERDGDGIQLSDLKILSHFRIRDEFGAITTPDTDQHAMIDVGLWIDNADHIKLNRVSVVGYWQKAGLYIDASGRLSQGGEFGAVEYATIEDCLFQGKIGAAILGGDEGNPPDEFGFSPPAVGSDEMSEGQFGISHVLVSDCFFSGTDHHSNGFASGWQQRIAPDSTPLMIDGFIGSGSPYRVNHQRFVNCSFQTRESASIVLNRVIRPAFVNCRAESGPIRASKYTLLPRLINCEFPYNRTNPAYQEIEHCPGAVIIPEFRRLGHVHLRSFEFKIELRNNNGVIEHRMGKANGIQSSAASKDVEALFRYAIQSGGWNYQTWSATPVPGNGASDDYSKGCFLGEKSFLAKYNLFTCAAIDNHPDYQEAEVSVVESRAADPQLWVRAAVFSTQNVPYRMNGYSSALKLELRNGSGPATTLSQNLPMENNGPASLILKVRGKFYEQIYGV
ncbi:glycosyl hydrolase family 28-related protein [Paenibacillus antri]|nr:glycosyl hydrolase family 28-related protein [Paenibacillus antri]